MVQTLVAVLVEMEVSEAGVAEVVAQGVEVAEV
jgi:hypothetical protein